MAAAIGDGHLLMKVGAVSRFADIISKLAPRRLVHLYWRARKESITPHHHGEFATICLHFFHVLFPPLPPTSFFRLVYILPHKTFITCCGRQYCTHETLGCSPVVAVYVTYSGVLKN